MSDKLKALQREVARCRVCADSLEHGPRPIVQLGMGASILIIGQAPGSRVHASGVPWDDDSGKRLREWMGIDETVFYDADKVALMPMGFCYPGKGPSGDLPPRPECAPLWHNRILDLLPSDRLTLLVGQYAQARYAPDLRRLSMGERVRHIGANSRFLLPHPAWRSVGWMKQNQWFEAEILPRLRHAVDRRLLG